MNDIVVQATIDKGTNKVVQATIDKGTIKVVQATIDKGTIKVDAVIGRLVTIEVDTPLESISAVYTQSGTVYGTDSLDTLKSDLVVTARYDDSTSQTVTDYELSGTLTEGTSTITVSYGGKSDTFNVQVSASGLLYRLSQPTTFNGTSDYIDTGIQLMKEPRDFTIVTTFSPQSVKYQIAFHCMHEVSPFPGLNLDLKVNKELRLIARGGTTINLVGKANAYIGGDRFTAIVRSRKVSDSKASYTGVVYDHTTGEFLDNYGINSWMSTNTFTSVEENLLIGCYQDTGGNLGRFFQGTIESFTVYDRIITDSEALNLLGMNYTPSTLTQRYSLPSETVFDGTSTYIDTNLAIMNDTKNYTIALTAVHGYTIDKREIMHCMHEVSPYPGISLSTGALSEDARANGSTQRSIHVATAHSNTKQAVVMRVVKDSGILYAVVDSRFNDGAEATKLVAGFSDYVPVTENLLIGAYKDTNGNIGRYWKGTLNDFKVYEGIMSDEDVEAYLQEAF